MQQVTARVWVSSPSKLLADGLGRILIDVDIPVTEHPTVTDVCLLDLTGEQGAYPDTPQVPTLALVKSGVPDALLVELLRAGYNGYIRSDADAAQLCHAVTHLLHHEIWAEPQILRTSMLGSKHGGLTRREQDVLRLLHAGHSNADIAALLGISLKTVKTHVSSVLAKQGVRRRIDLIVSSTTHATKRVSNAFPAAIN